MAKETKESVHKGSVQSAKSIPVVGIGAGVACLSLVGYLGLCGIAQASPVIISDITIADVPVVGMNRYEAVEAVSHALAQQLENTSITYTGTSWNGVLEGDIAQAQVDLAVDLAYDMGRDNFFTSGFSYMTGMTSGNSDISIALALNDSGLVQFHTLLDEADAAMNGSVVESVWNAVPETGELWVTKGVSGVSVDRDAMETATLTALSTGSSSNVTLSTDITPPKELDFSAIAAEVYALPVSAEIDSETMEVSEHVLGVELDSVNALALYNAAKEGETFAIPLEITQPEQTRDDIVAFLFADVLASVSSRVTGTSTRIANVGVAAELSNGVILMPGEVYSYYENSGPYNQSNGYGVATAYVGGQTVSEVGGGVCQISSTIYYAVLHTDLEIVSRRNHQFTIDYLPPGMDATVYSDLTDFQFRNSSEYPIKLEINVEVRDGRTYSDVTIWGTKTDDIRVEPVNTVSNYVSYSTEYVANAEIPAGSSKTVQTAYTGCTATVTRNYYDGNDNLILQEHIDTSRYGGRPAIVHYNPADGASYGQAVPEATPEAAPTEPAGTDTGMVLPDSGGGAWAEETIQAPEASPAPEATPEPSPEPTPEPSPAPEASAPVEGEG